jgi:uncharacterized membrane protein (DUF485 family)
MNVFKLVLGGAVTVTMFVLAGVFFYKAKKEQERSDELIHQAILLDQQFQDLCNRYGG